MNQLIKHFEKARNAQPQLADLAETKRRSLLTSLARELIRNQDRIRQANLRDLKELAETSAFRDRLLLDKQRLQALSRSVIAVASLPGVLNRTLETRKLKNGLVILKISVPLGVVGAIYESRPNVTIDLAALAFKSGNALILKGGKESYETNKYLVSIIRRVLRKHKLSKDLIYLISPKDDWKKTLLKARGLIDVLIPRGGSGLIDYVRTHARVPVIETGAGVCHTFVDKNFDLHKSVEIIVNAKTQRPSVCNSLDTLVVHRKAVAKLLRALASRLAAHRVEIYADYPAYFILRKYYPAELLRPAKPGDYGKEFLSLKMSVKTVDSFAAGLKFVKAKTSHHSEAIVSNDRRHVKRFLEEIDAAVVYDNVSTRFTDGGEFGMGAEVGISTQKLHARGPMGAEALTSYKWVVSAKIAVRA